MELKWTGTSHAILNIGEQELEWYNCSNCPLLDVLSFSSSVVFFSEVIIGTGSHLRDTTTVAHDTIDHEDEDDFVDVGDYDDPGLMLSVW